MRKRLSHFGLALVASVALSDAAMGGT